jgi:hypothetical protein
MFKLHGKFKKVPVNTFLMDFYFWCEKNRCEEASLGNLQEFSHSIKVTLSPYVIAIFNELTTNQSCSLDNFLDALNRRKERPQTIHKKALYRNQYSKDGALRHNELLMQGIIPDDDISGILLIEPNEDTLRTALEIWKNLATTRSEDDISVSIYRITNKEGTLTFIEPKFMKALFKFIFPEEFIEMVPEALPEEQMEIEQSAPQITAEKQENSLNIRISTSLLFKELKKIEQKSKKNLPENNFQKRKRSESDSSSYEEKETKRMKSEADVTTNRPHATLNIPEKDAQEDEKGSYNFSNTRSGLKVKLPQVNNRNMTFHASKRKERDSEDSSTKEPETKKSRTEKEINETSSSMKQ